MDDFWENKSDPHCWLKISDKAKVIFGNCSSSLKCINIKNLCSLFTVGSLLKVGICWKFKLITNFLVPWIKPMNYSHHGNAQEIYTFKIVIVQFNLWHW